jgi:hypothetical protein
MKRFGFMLVDRPKVYRPRTESQRLGVLVGLTLMLLSLLIAVFFMLKN